MNAIKFPDMIVSNRTMVVTDKDATYQNLKTLLQSEKYTLLGDPYFGSNIMALMFNNNNAVLRDIVVDDIYTVISTYMPQIRVLRENITVTSNRNSVNVKIFAQNLLDYSFDEYQINLLKTEEI